MDHKTDTDQSILLTVDVEDWAGSSLHLLSPREATIAQNYLSVFDPQLERGLHRLLEFLDGSSGRATFFILVRTARIHKQLARLSHDCGHEIGSHSLNHLSLQRLSPGQLEEELGDSKKFLEDSIGAPVSGFRAPRLTGYPKTTIYRKILESAGYVYDSSFTATRWKLISGQKGPSVFPDDHGAKLLEFPVTTSRFMLWNMPVGGTYLKFLGIGGIGRILDRTTNPEIPLTIYLHPYEVDRFALQWRHPHPSIRARFALAIRNAGKGRYCPIISYLTHHHRVRSINEWLDRHRKAIFSTATTH